MKSFEEIYEDNKIDELIKEFFDLYKEAKKYARIADYRSKHDNGPLLADDKLQESDQFSDPDEDDLKWKKRAIYKLNEINKLLDDKKEKLILEINIKRQKGQKINWSSSSKKEDTEELVLLAKEQIEASKDVRQLSLETDKKLNDLLNILKQYNLL